jgi:hypothetical protein
MLGVETRITKESALGEKALAAHRDRMMKAASIGFAHSQELVPQDRGTLLQSAFPPEFRGDDVVFGYTQPYAGSMEFGTRPYWPPIQPLIEWARRVGLPEGAAYGVQAKIAQEGIDEQPYLRPAADRMRRYLKSHGSR